MVNKWDERFLELAELVASWSKDPSTKVGAVIADDNRRIVSVGYNGFPQGISDDPADLANRSVKYERIIHAEMNAILFADRSHFRGGLTLYTWPFSPCSRCASYIVQAGINRVVTRPNTDPRWAESFALAHNTFNQAGVEFIEIGVGSCG